MTNIQVFYYVLFLVITSSCGQKPKGTVDYKSLPVDTNKINIFNWDTSLYTFTNYSEPLPITLDDIKIVDSLLVDAVDKFDEIKSKELYEAFHEQVSIDSFKIYLSKYKRQYFPYKDVNGHRVFYVVCFSKPFSEWRKKIYYGGIHGGLTRFTFKVDLSDRKTYDFSYDGYG